MKSILIKSIRELDGMNFLWKCTFLTHFLRVSFSIAYHIKSNHDLIIYLMNWQFAISISNDSDEMIWNVLNSMIRTKYSLAFKTVCFRNQIKRNNFDAQIKTHTWNIETNEKKKRINALYHRCVRFTTDLCITCIIEPISRCTIGISIENATKMIKWA